MESPAENPDIPNIESALSALSVLTERHGAAAGAADELTATAGGVKGSAVVAKENEDVTIQRNIIDETSEEGSAEAADARDDDDDGASGSQAATTPPRKVPEEAVTWCALPTVAEGSEGFEVAGILEELMGLDCSTFATSSDETKGAKQRNEGSDVAVAADRLKHDILKSLSKGYETVAEATETVADVTEKTCFPICQEMMPQVDDVEAQEVPDEDEEAKAQAGEAEKAEVEDSKNPSKKIFLGRTRSFPKPPAKMPAVPSPMSSFRRIRSHQPSPTPSQQQSPEKNGEDSDVSLATLDSLSKGRETIAETTTAGAQERVAKSDQEKAAKNEESQADRQGEAASQDLKKSPKIPRARSFPRKQAQTKTDRQGEEASQDLKKPPKIPRARSFPRKSALPSPMSSLRRIRSNQSSSSQLSSEKTDSNSKEGLVASDNLVILDG